MPIVWMIRRYRIALVHELGIFTIDTAHAASHRFFLGTLATGQVGTLLADAPRACLRIPPPHQGQALRALRSL